MAIYYRHIEAKLLSQLEYQPAVMIEGARQTGKSTLAREIGKRTGHTYWTFDDEPTRQSAIDDPSGFVSRLDDRVILDEVQRAPGLALALKSAIDHDRVNGRFILTGSSSNQNTSELESALVGRLGLTQLHPLAQSEIAGEPPALIDRLYQGEFGFDSCERLGTRLAEMIFKGGYPSVQNVNSDAAVTGWYQDYIETQIRQVVAETRRLAAGVELRSLVAALATQVSQLTNISKLASELGIDRRTANEYFKILIGSYIVDRLPAWTPNRLKQEIKGAKLHLTDTGLVAAAVGLDSPTIWNERETMGALFESFVLQEIRREMSGMPDQREGVFHYRQKQLFEVDILIVSPARGTLGIEIKSGATVRKKHFEGLKKLKEVVPKFTTGVVIYDGERCLPFADGMWAVPAGMLFGRGG